MKLLSILFVLVATQAHADISGIRYNILSVQPKTATNPYSGGAITIGMPSGNKQDIEVQLQREFRCPPGRFCAQVMPAPEVHLLPVVSNQAIGCASNYVAQSDQRPVDGALVRLEVSGVQRSPYCPPTAQAPKARLTISYYDRLHGRPVTNTLIITLENRYTIIPFTR